MDHRARMPDAHLENLCEALVGHVRVLHRLSAQGCHDAAPQFHIALLPQPLTTSETLRKRCVHSL